MTKITGLPARLRSLPHALRSPCRNYSFAPLGLGGFLLPTHGLRRGLYSCAASQLVGASDGTSSADRVPVEMGKAGQKNNSLHHAGSLRPDEGTRGRGRPRHTNPPTLRGRALAERLEGLLLAVIDIENGHQLGYLQQVSHALRQVGQLDRTAAGASGGIERY